MIPFHTQFDWRALDAATGHEVVDGGVIVVQFKGACQADLMPPYEPGGGSLGLTHITDGQILPFAEVDCDKIRKLMATELMFTPSSSAH